VRERIVDWLAATEAARRSSRTLELLFRPDWLETDAAVGATNQALSPARQLTCVPTPLSAVVEHHRNDFVRIVHELTLHP
jgi:hypothetical protein